MTDSASVLRWHDDVRGARDRPRRDDDSRRTLAGETCCVACIAVVPLFGEENCPSLAPAALHSLLIVFEL